MDNIVNIMSSVDFPIAMTLLLFWYMTKQLDKMAEIQKEHKVTPIRSSNQLHR